eukprot:3333886-Pyramimonas_sp.AAC.1
MRQLHRADWCLQYLSARRRRAKYHICELQRATDLLRSPGLCDVHRIVYYQVQQIVPHPGKEKD